MLTMRAAAALLSSSRSPRGLADVVQATGLVSAAVDIDPPTRRGLGLDGVERAELAAGNGAIRLLLLHLRHRDSLRDELLRVAHRLSARAPHVLWLVAAIDQDGRNAGIVGWSSGERAPRVASFLWETDHVVDSDAETLCTLASVRGDDDMLVYARCIEVLGRGALTRRFYRALQSQVAALAESVPSPADDARAVALQYTSRLLFLCFLEAKGWLNGDRAFIASRFDECMRRGGGFHQRVLLPLFFGTLNTPPARRAPVARALGHIPFLNGGLFTRTPLERRAGRWRFSDEQMGALLAELFQRFRFVAREDSANWSEASVDPEMLGRSFESLMAAAERRASGVYYTPHQLVARVAEHALSAARSSTLRARDLRVLDPACGSGAFLVYMLERLADLRREEGDPGSVASIRRDVLAKSIFGVDRSPTAAWLCELRLWLSVVIESDERDPKRVPPLPNLDRNIRIGDALSGPAFVKDVRATVGGARIIELRERYVRATGVRKESLARALDREERRRVSAQLQRDIDSTRFGRAELIAAQRSRDLFGQRAPPSPEAKRELKRLREALRALRSERRRVADGGALPFSFGAFFADAQARGGFDVVLGNPPWVRLHRIPVGLRLEFRRTYEVFRSAHWRAGAEAARAAPGFASQVDLAALFVERSVALLREDGVVSLLLPMKLWCSLAGGGLRQLLHGRTRVLRLEDLSESKHAFNAAVYPSLLLAKAGLPAGRGPSVRLAIHERGALREWEVRPANLALDDSPGAPWIVLSPDAREAFDRVRAVGASLAASFGAPRLGVKSGCNSAFVVRVTDSTRDLARVVNADGEKGLVEVVLLRPALRGDGVQTWDRRPCEDWILWTHDAQGAALARLPERAREWLRRHYGQLTVRSDAARVRRWWSLFRVDAADATTARVVWADFGRRPRALVLPASDPAVPLNTCYVLKCPDPRDAWALAAILNSRLAAAWLNTLAEPARGGYRRYLGWTVGQLPLPRDWPRARAILASVSRADDDRLLAAVLDAYRLQRADVAALLEWRA